MHLFMSDVIWKVSVCLVNGLILLTIGQTAIKIRKCWKQTTPSVFHANYRMSQKVLIRLDQYKYKLLVPVSISGDVGLGLST